MKLVGFPSDSVVKNPPVVREVDSIPGKGRSPGGENSDLLQYYLCACSVCTSVFFLISVFLKEYFVSSRLKAQELGNK